jgi:hypothetical protein
MAAQYWKLDIQHISSNTLQEYLKDSLRQETGKL